MWEVLKYPSGHCAIRSRRYRDKVTKRGALHRYLAVRNGQGGAITVGSCTSLAAAEAVVRLLDRNPAGLSCT